MKRTLRKRVAIYLRCSTNKQDESVSTQRDMLQRYADDHNFEIVVEFVDEAVSGDSSRKRTGLQKLLAVAKRGEFDIVVVRQLARLSRRDSLKSARQIVGPLFDAGVAIHTLDHGELNPRDATSRIMLHIIGEMEHSENVSRSLNVTAGMLRVAEAGYWATGIAPYGYRAEGPKRQRVLVLGPVEEVNTIRRIFEEYASGKPVPAIAKGLNDDGVPTLAGNKWNVAQIGNLVRREVYCGDYFFNKRRGGKYYSIRGGQAVEREDQYARHDEDQDTPLSRANAPSDWIVHRDRWPAIVSRSLWHKVQRRVASQPRHRRDAYRYRLSGLVRCSCGHRLPMGGSTPNASTTKRYLCQGCGSVVHEEKLLKAVGEAFQNTLDPRTLVRFKKAVSRAIAKPSKPKGPSVPALRRQLLKYEKRLLDVADDMVDIVSDKIRELRSQIEEAEVESVSIIEERPDRIVERAVEQLKQLPEMLVSATDEAFTFRREAIDRIEVCTERTEKGCATRHKLLGGTVHLSTHTEIHGSRPRT